MTDTLFGTTGYTNSLFLQDMHSYSVEVARGIAFHNIVTSIMQEHRMGISAAMEWLGNFGKQRIDTFLNAVKELPSWGQEVDQNVSIYIKRIGHLVRGADEWSYESERYWERRGSEIQSTRLVTFIPEVEESQEGLLTKEELRTAIVA